VGRGVRRLAGRPRDRRARHRRLVHHRPPAAGDHRRPRRAAVLGADAPAAADPARRARPADPAALLRARDAAAESLVGAANGKTLERALAALERCRELFADGALPGPGALGAAGFKAGNTKALKTPPCEAYLEAHEAYVQALVDEQAVAAAVELDALLARYADTYAAAKRARSGLDFDDLELLTRDLLRDAPMVRAAYGERFERILVDEFQDSNPLQLELFDLLGGAGDGTPVFLVGDERQSIYGFRHADVEVFRRRRDALEADGRALELRRNFRSHPAVLDVVNAVFDERPLVAGRESGDGGDGPRVELLITSTQGWEESGVDLGELPRTQRWRQAEARLLAQRVRDLVDRGEHGPEDVVVLVRATGDLPVFERALEDAGLQTLASGGRGYWGRQVVRDLCAWLAALANPRDELALLGVLASPLVGASTDALALVAEGGRGNAWRVIDAAFGPQPEEGAADAEWAAAGSRLRERLGEDDRVRVAAFRERFAAERERAPPSRTRRAAAPGDRGDRLRPARAAAPRRRAAPGQRPQAAAARRRPRARARPRHPRAGRPGDRRARGRRARARRAGRAGRREGRPAHDDPRGEGPRVPRRLRRRPRAPHLGRRAGGARRGRSARDPAAGARRVVGARAALRGAARPPPRRRRRRGAADHVRRAHARRGAAHPQRRRRPGEVAG
jgi:hypothetical protein